MKKKKSLCVHMCEGSFHDLRLTEIVCYGETFESYIQAVCKLQCNYIIIIL